MKFKTWLTRQLWKKQYPTKDDWKRINNIDWDKIATQEAAEVIHSTPPPRWSRSYNSFSGVDCKLYFRGEDGSMRTLSETQKIAIRHNKSGTWFDLTCVLFDRSSLPLLKTATDVYVCAANEYGSIGQMDFEGIEFQSMTFSISIDDIVCDEVITFHAKTFEPFRAVKETARDIKFREEGLL
jgi:hypothetical protein